MGQESQKKEVKIQCTLQCVPGPPRGDPNRLGTSSPGGSVHTEAGSGKSWTWHGRWEFGAGELELLCEGVEGGNGVPVPGTVTTSCYRVCG